MRIDDNTPILVGGGQVTQRHADPQTAREPVDMMADAAVLAAGDAGVAARVLQQVDTLAVVNILAWNTVNAPGWLAQRVGAQPKNLIYTQVGGNTPQWLVNESAEKIARGESECVLIAGVEAMASINRARKAGVKLEWVKGDAPGQPTAAVVGGNRQGANDEEMAYGMTFPIAVYPMFENALRAHYGRSIADHQRALGELYARFSAVAATNPYAWFPTRRTAEEISTPSADNRMIGFPYTKVMNAIMDVDQAAAVLMMSVGKARALGIDESRWVYLWGCGDAIDQWFVSERVNYFTSPAIRMACSQSLKMAGVGVDDIDHFDLYSCFPSAVQLARDSLCIAVDDPRDLTVTGGLAYAGGPGNNYVTHSIATMMQRVRERRGSKGLVTGLGWYVTKHSAGIYSAEPPPRAFQRVNPTTYQAEIDAQPHPNIVPEPSGAATVETYTVLHDREGAPMRGVVIGRLADGSRFLSNTSGDRAELESMMQSECVGRSGRVTRHDSNNIFGF